MADAEDNAGTALARLYWAGAFLQKLAQEGIEQPPSVGLDHEGTYSFMWMNPSVQADLTVYEDGTYSFFARSAEGTASADDARIDAPLDSRLIAALKA